jgi:hypothetical protein
MNKLRIIVPSRERPESAARLIHQIAGTLPEDSDLSVMFAVDRDDPRKLDYPLQYTRVVEGGTMVKALNEMALESMNDFEYLGFLGDDTLPHGDWYHKIVEALEATPNSVVYGNDLIYGSELPTGCFLDSNIVRTLGFMAPPAQKHLYVDNFWRQLGQTLGTLNFVEDAIIEHLHPLGGKAESDAVYEAAYTKERWNHDQTAFEAYIETNFLNDVKRFV